MPFRHLSSLVGLALCIAAPVVHASLGGDATSIASDSVALGGSRTVERMAGWEVHVLRLPSGVVVREYLHGETVFAVAWSGRTLPNLRRLLGAYFEPYVESTQGHGAHHHHRRVVTTPDWVVQSVGHHGGFFGRAWLRNALPSGFDLETLRAW
jgi:Protein of unknown function (DUF2844)